MSLQLSDTVQSVVSQSGIPACYSLEIVIGNDSHYSIETIQSVLNFVFTNSNMSLVVVNNPSKACAGFNRNCAIKNSTGDFLAFLDSDDIWLPSKLSKQLELVSRGFNFISTSYFVSDINYLLSPAKVTNVTNAFYLLNPIGTSTVLVSRALISNIEFTGLKFSQDILFWAYVIKQPHFSYATVPEPLVVYSRSGRTSNSSVCEQLFYFYSASFSFSRAHTVAFFSTIIYIVRSTFRPFVYLKQKFF